MGDEVTEVRWRWFTHLQRRDGGYIRIKDVGDGADTYCMRKGGRAQRRVMDVVKHTGEMVGLTLEEAVDIQ